MGRQRELFWMVVGGFTLVLLAAACGNVENQPALSTFSIGLTAIDGDAFVQGEPTGLTAHFDAADQDVHGLPSSGELIANGPNRARVNVAMEAWVNRTSDEQPIPFGCFGPIELRDDDDTALLVITDFCDATNPRIEATIDFRTDTAVRWRYQTPDGERVTQLAGS